MPAERETPKRLVPVGAGGDVQRIDKKRAGDVEGQQRSCTNPGQEDTLSRTPVCRRLLGRVAGLLLAGVLAACGGAPSGQAGGQGAGTPARASPAATARGRPPGTPGGSVAVDV